MVRSTLFALTLAFMLAATTQAQTRTTREQQASETLQAADVAFQNRDFAQTENLIRSIVGDPQFGDLPEGFRQYARQMLGAALLYQGKCDEAPRIFEHLTSEPAANERDWVGLFVSYQTCHQDQRATAALATIVQRVPSALSMLDDEVIVKFAERSDDAALLSYLVNGGWRPQTPVEVARLRLRLVRVYLAQHRQDLAAESAQALVINGATDLGSIVMLFVDRTFDPITSADPQTFDFDGVMEWQLNNARQRVASTPDSLQALNSLAEALLTRNRLDEANTLLEQTIARVDAAGSETPLFQDQAEQINWSRNIKSRIEDAMGDDDQALATLRRGAEELEHGAANVSQRLNLGAQLVELGRGAEALSELRDFDTSHTSPYGMMVYHRILVCASVQSNDLERARSEYAYMREHAEDSLSNLEDAALCLDDLDFAARTFIRQLNSEFDRRGALLDVQQFIGDRSVSQHQTDIFQRRLSMRERADVQAAINRVGRVRSFPIRRPPY